MVTDTLVWPLDRARTRLFTSALKIGVLRGLLLDKRRRIAALLTLHAGAAFALSIFAPTLLLLFAPLLLGVPHLVADVRFLALRPQLGAHARAVLLGGSGLLLAWQVGQTLGMARADWAEVALAGGMLLAVTLAAARAATGWRVALVLAAALLLVGLGLIWPRAFRLGLSHAHNLVALGLWAFAFARRRRSAASLALGVLVLAALLLCTPLAWLGFSVGLRECFGLHAFGAADTLAPGVSSATLALGIVSSFAFLQSMHYAVWLHAVPQEETRGNATLTFRMSARTLRGELGAWGLGGAAALCVAVPAAALFGSARGVKDLYLSLSSFHAYLELAAAAAFFVSGVRPAASCRDSTCS